jgi:hypothetical protein
MPENVINFSSTKRQQAIEFQLNAKGLRNVYEPQNPDLIVVTATT